MNELNVHNQLPRQNPSNGHVVGPNGCLKDTTCIIIMTTCPSMKIGRHPNSTHLKYVQGSVQAQQPHSWDLTDTFNDSQPITTKERTMSEFKSGNYQHRFQSKKLKKNEHMNYIITDYIQVCLNVIFTHFLFLL